MDYRRIWKPGGTYFFTVNLLQRNNSALLVQKIDLLRQVVAKVKGRCPFIIHAWVVLPDHIHCVIELPPNDHDFSLRWRLIKQGFSKALPTHEYRSDVRINRGERGVWQRRYWEHFIRDEADFNAHLNYVQINPLKHGLVQRVIDWPYSTFNRYYQRGLYPIDWCDGGLLLPECFD